MEVVVKCLKCYKLKLNVSLLIEWKASVNGK